MKRILVGLVLLVSMSVVSVPAVAYGQLFLFRAECVDMDTSPDCVRNFRAGIVRGLEIEPGATSEIFTMANIREYWLTFSDAGWLSYYGGFVPRFSREILSSVRWFSLGEARLSAVVGAQLYIGYGTEPTNRYPCSTPWICMIFHNTWGMQEISPTIGSNKDLNVEISRDAGVVGGSAVLLVPQGELTLTSTTTTAVPMGQTWEIVVNPPVSPDGYKIKTTLVMNDVIAHAQCRPNAEWYGEVASTCYFSSVQVNPDHLKVSFQLEQVPPTIVYGCMDPTATNYNPNATSQTGVTCTYPAPTCTLSASPASIQSGNLSSLSWVTTNATVSFSIDNGIGVVTPVASGSRTVSPTVTTTYTGTATGNGGTVTCGKTVTVTAPPPPVVYGCMDPTATNYNPNATSQTGVTCTYPAPTCTLSASPASIQSGNLSSLSWVTTNATVSFSIDNGIGVVTPVASGSRTVSPTVTTTYTGTATGNGGTVTCGKTVTVTAPPDDDNDDDPPPPPIIYGCMDTVATNFNPAATADDGSCTYLPPPPPS